MASFPFFELRGEPDELGTAAGNLFGDRISANYDFYEGLFAEVLKVDLADKGAATRLRDAVVNHASEFERAVAREFPLIDAEIKAMSRAANLPPWKIYTLNARTEIYRLLVKDKLRLTSTECTSLFFPESSILGQTWDWHPTLEELCVVAKITLPSGLSFVMLTEPGIVGKIGLNSSGVGVCLNILFADCEIKGIPIHVLLRAILESSSFHEALSVIENATRGTVSNLLLADDRGNAIDLELLGSELRNVTLPSGALLHTNHYFADQKQAAAAVPGSVYRLERAQALYETHSSAGVDGMKKILSDRENPDFPICRAYSQGIDFLVGTVAAVVMDLPNRTFFVTKGQPSGNSSWATIALR